MGTPCFGHGIPAGSVKGGLNMQKPTVSQNFKCECGANKCRRAIHCRKCSIRLRTAELNVRFRHGHNGASGKSPTYNSWDMMRQRCNNPKYTDYRNYGGRGIKVCDSWSVFSNFLKDMGERPIGKTLDRKDTNGDYTPENCKWSTRIEQARNMRRTIWIDHNGEHLVLTDWAKKLGVCYQTLRIKYHKGLWPA
jgi:hypothetical protein